MNPFAGVNAEEAQDDDKDKKDEGEEKSTTPSNWSLDGR